MFWKQVPLTRFKFLSSRSENILRFYQLLSYVKELVYVWLQREYAWNSINIIKLVILIIQYLPVETKLCPSLLIYALNTSDYTYNIIADFFFGILECVWTFYLKVLIHKNLNNTWGIRKKWHLGRKSQNQLTLTWLHQIMRNSEQFITNYLIHAVKRWKIFEW